MRVLWIGTYEREYPRTRVLIEGLRAHGVEVITRNVDVWGRHEHKTGLRPLQTARLAGGFALAWCRLLAGARRCGPVDLVVAGYPAQPDALGARVVAAFLRAPLAVDAMVSLEDTFAGDRSLVRGAGARALHLVDRTTTGLARVVIVDTAAHAAFFRHRFAVPERKIIVVPVGAEPDLFPPAPTPPDGDRVLFYGKLSPLHGLETVLTAARTPGVPPVRIIGRGQLSAWLDAELRRAPGTVEHVPWVPYAELGREIAAATVCLGVFGTSEKAARVVPNKVYQAMAVGRAIVTADTPAVREVLTHELDALLVPPGDAAGLAAALRRLTGDPDLRQRLGAAARARYEQVGTPAAVAGRLLAGLPLSLGEPR